MREMTKTEFFKKTEHYHGRVGDWDIVLDRLSVAGFVIGCYYVESDKKWKVYKNGERGLQVIRLETTSEEALDELYSMIEFENKMDIRYKEMEAKRKNQMILKACQPALRADMLCMDPL